MSSKDNQADILPSLQEVLELHIYDTAWGVYIYFISVFDIFT